jgi:hypothetical protein
VVRAGNRPANIAAPERKTSMTFVRSLPILAIMLTAGAAMAADEPPAAADQAVAERPNLLKNPGFEDVTARGGPAQWINKQHAGVRAYDFSVVDDPHRSGERSMMIRRLQKQVWGKTEQIVRVDPDMAGKTVEFEIWVRSEKVGAKGYMVRIGAFAGSALLDFVKSERFAGDGDWTRRTLRLKVPEYTSQLVVAMTLEDEGAIWMDDARLSVVAQP